MIQRSSKARQAALPLIAISIFLSCGHVAHRADIEPGFNATFLGGPAYNTYSYKSSADYSEPRKEPSWETRDSQMNIGYAWQLNNGKRLLAQIVFVRIDNDENQHESATSVDIYYQTKSGHNSAGMGLMVGLDPKFYFIWGRNYGRQGAAWRTGLDFSMGFGIVGAPVMAQLMYSLRFKEVQISALGEYRYFFLNTDYDFGDGSNPSNIIRSRLFMGLAFTLDSYRIR